ncbi:MAG: preprotein translocase subunit YajC [Dehalococcoidia bacterium]|nr:preprotein translocase subunit YajC [Dehalococcoidia bacterium]
MDPSLALLIGLTVVWFAVLFIGLPWLQSRRQQRLLKELGHGDEVVVLNGVFGKVSKVDGGVIEVEIAPKVKVRCLPSAISRGVSRR